jgi:hypothetical protein
MHWLVALIAFLMPPPHDVSWTAIVTHPSGWESLLTVRSRTREAAVESIVSGYCVEQIGFGNCLTLGPWRSIYAPPRLPRPIVATTYGH